ncbi:histidine kinase [Actinoplanes sp. NBRC 103695]|uniref:sensor histidine kinase n=1 Tax=Actinoplanes sp. NBRC 103695 TaxID=3032202 RepID=UPI0024A1938D|nr:histidine kinase [Actinoplanes sp. NBRC 103695]GLY92967.1 two-component sensor histidine kinase [Actinoplanes sp. NBRC 103695]
MWRAALRERWRSSLSFQDRSTAAATFAAGLAFNLVGLTGLWLEPMTAAPRWWHSVLLVAGCVAMLHKRAHPVPMLVAGAAVATADLLLGGSMGMVLVLFDLIFSAGQFASDRARTVVTTAVFVVIGTASVVGGLATGEFRIAVFVGLQMTTLLFVPLWWSANIRQQRELGALAAERTAREAVLAERAAMARDLHDVIAAHLSTTALRSGAALAMPPDTDRDRSALGAVRASSLAALEEMRSMIMLLRAAEDPVVPGGLDRLPELVEAATSGGLTVDARLTAGEDVPVVVGHGVYRIVREALTNARKHAPGSRVRVEVSRVGDRLRVTVANTLTYPSDHLDHDALTAGSGLPSMRERAALLGGEATAGRDADGWQVHATLPLHDAR